MAKDRILETLKAYKLAHQVLCVKAFNFQGRSLIDDVINSIKHWKIEFDGILGVGYVELTIYPLRADFKRIKLNSKQCRIYRVLVNDTWESTFWYNDPTLEAVQDEDVARQCGLETYEKAYNTAVKSTNPDLGNGEVTVRLPADCIPLVADLQPLRLNIEFSLEQPEGGLHFVLPSVEGTLAERGAHCFTYRHENSSRLWFPCIDSYAEPCTWKLEFTCDLEMTAVSCGDLLEVAYTTDRRAKTYHYYLSTPTSAPNIALAVGPFEMLVDPNMHEVTHFCLPHLKGVLKHTTSYLHESFEFFEELMSSRYPFSCYKQVFVDESYEDAQSFATMTIFNTNLLHSARVIDQTIITRKFMAAGIAQQFFGCFIVMESWFDAWLTKGIAAFLTQLFVKKTFGNNEYRHEIAQYLQEVQDYEAQSGGIVLDPSGGGHNNQYFSCFQPHTMSPSYLEMYNKKSLLILRMLEARIGATLLLQVFNKLQALAFAASQQKFLSNTWSNMLLSANSFLKIISTVTGKDIQPFIDQWILQSGCARFVGNFVFNRKRNVVELEIKQDHTAKGALRYVGPLEVTIQELDGSFNHTFNIEENKTKFEITCHSKSRRNKKKKIPLLTGEEVDMDLNAMDADSPVLWLRVDKDMNLLRCIQWEQPDYMWQYQLKYERDIVAQSEAIQALRLFATPATRKALTDVLECEQSYYKVRIDASMCLAKVANTMVTSWAGPPAMLNIFRKMFGSHSCPGIVRQNNFSKFQHYFILKSVPMAMAQLRNVHNICPPEVVRFLLDLFKYNDNSKNKYSDNYYRAVLVDALAATVTPAVTTVTITGQSVNSDLSADTKAILDEITRCLNLEKLLSCYRHTVTVSCLRAIRVLQKFGHLPSDPCIFRSYAEHGVFRDIRLVAIESLVDFIKTDWNVSELYWLLEVVEKDPDIFVSNETIQMLSNNPPFRRGEDNLLNTEVLVNRLYKLMNSTLSHDAKLRCGVAEFYFVMFGRYRPACLHVPESFIVFNMNEKKKPAMINPAIVSEQMTDMFEEDDDDLSSFLSTPTVTPLTYKEESVLVDVESHSPEKPYNKPRAQSPPRIPSVTRIKQLVESHQLPLFLIDSKIKPESLPGPLFSTGDRNNSETPTGSQFLTGSKHRSESPPGHLFSTGSKNGSESPPGPLFSTGVRRMSESPEVPEFTSGNKHISESPQGPPFPRRTDSPQGPPFPRRTESPQGPPFPHRTESPQGPPFPHRTESPQGPPFPRRTDSPQGPPFPHRTESPQEPPFPHRTESLQGPPFSRRTESPQGPPFSRRTESPPEPLFSTGSKYRSESLPGTPIVIGSKRRAKSPTGAPPTKIPTLVKQESASGEDSNPVRLKIKFGNLGNMEGGIQMTSRQAVSMVTNVDQLPPVLFPEFLRFSRGPEDSHNQQSKSMKCDIPGMSYMGCDSQSRLSEDSNSSQDDSSLSRPPPPLVKTEGPTSFHGMFSSSLSTGHPVSDATSATMSMATGETPNADAGKQYRVKKKKKKNKHKHKHKHKHERHERDRGRDSKERFSVSGVASPMVPSVQSITSMSSVDNGRDSAPSSPEFEVI